MPEKLVPCPCAEFDCCECGRHIIAIAVERPPEPPLCGACTFMPGWFRNPEIRAVLDPDHSGEEVGHA